MELKCATVAYEIQSKLVLIVPLWNWNSDEERWTRQGDQGSNRTFMELKLDIDLDNLSADLF